MVRMFVTIIPGPSLFHEGEIMHVRVFGQSMIILNSLEAVVDLLEKRSSNYSDRPRAEMLSL